MNTSKKQCIASLIIVEILAVAFCFGVNITHAKPTVVDATFEMYPSTLNLAGVGKEVICLIELSGGYDVNNITPTAIRLNNSIYIDLASPAVVGDYNNNNVSDLIVAFSRAEIIDFILSENITYGNITLTLYGVVSHNLQFAGHDTVAVSNLIGDVNCDGRVAINDIVEAIAGFRTEEGEVNWNANANFAPVWNRLDIQDLVTIAYHYGENIGE